MLKALVKTDEKVTFSVFLEERSVVVFDKQSSVVRWVSESNLFVGPGGNVLVMGLTRAKRYRSPQDVDVLDHSFNRELKQKQMAVR